MTNRDIAVIRAARLAREGGDMTGGQMGADEIVFSETKSPSSLASVMPNKSASSCPGRRCAEKPPETPAKVAAIPAIG